MTRRASRQGPPIHVLAAFVLLLIPPGDRWFGADKIKHFFMSAMVQSTAFSAARAAGLQRGNAQAIGGVSTMGVALWKEMYDRRTGRGFSVKDLVWDAAGGVGAAALLNGAR
jgi:uncharacterized protein YfiM (DUF2279 family)